MKSHKTTITALAALAALSGVASANAESRVTPILRAEISYSNTGYSEQYAPKGYEAGPGLTAGVLINKKHEVSLSTGFTKFNGDHRVIPSVVDVGADLEQIPVLLNYRYHVSLDNAGRYSVFAGPTVGFIHEKYSQTQVDLGGWPIALRGTSSATKWRSAFGGTIGFTAKLGKGWDLSATAQALSVAGNTYLTHGGTSTFTLEKAIRPSFGLSVGYSW